jgi:hypothetical protein
MKTKLFGLIILALLTLFSCKEKEQETEIVIEEIESPDYASFDKKLSVIRSFYQAHSDEDLEAQMAMISDTLKWSPPDYNGNKWLGKEDYLTALKGYHDAFDNIKYIEGISMPDDVVNGFWSGAVYPKEGANTDPNVIRVYGTWTATHTESGKKIGVKWFSLVTVNENGKLVQASDYFDVNGLAKQIAAED